MTTTPMPQPIFLNPTGDAQEIRFRGLKLASRSNERRGRRRWWIATVYEVEAPASPSARYVIALHGCSAVPGEADTLAVQWFPSFRCPAAARYLRECSRRGAHVVADAVREAGLLPVRDLSEETDG